MHLFTSNKNLFTSSKFPLFILLFFCFASAILGDSVAEALILSHFDATVIPRMYIVNALFLFFSSLFLMSFIDRIDRGKFFVIFLGSHCLVLFLIWCAVSFGITFFYIPLFSYAYVTKIFLFLMFWTLANDIIDSRQAGAEFPFIAAGGTLGAIGISFSIPWLLKLISASSLLVVWIVVCLFVLVCFLPVKKTFGKYFMQISDREKHLKRNLRSIINDATLIGREPLLANMSLLYFLLFFILLNQHYAFYQAIKDRFIAAERLAGFLGYFNGISMGATFFLQVTLAGVILHKIGSTRSMFMLPAVLCFVFGMLSVIGILADAGQQAYTVVPLLFWGIVGGVGLRIAFFDSFFSPNFQIFFSSLPQDIRGRGKLVIEGLIKPTAMIFASLWLLFITSRLSFSMNMIILFCFSIIMIIQTFRIRASYTESLAQYLGDFKSRVSLSLFDPTEVSDSGDMLAFLSRKLAKESYEIKCYVIELLAQINSEESITVLKNYLYKSDKQIRATIVSSLTRLKRDDLKSLFKLLLRDTDERVVANTIFALAAYNDKDMNDGLQAYLFHENHRIKANTIIALWQVSDRVKRKAMVHVLEKMLYARESDVCASALFALREIAAPEESSMLLPPFFLRRRDAILQDRTIWFHFLRAVARTPIDDLIESVLHCAGAVNKKMRNDIVGMITEACANGYPVGTLIGSLSSGDVILRGIVLKMLGILKPDEMKERESLMITIAEEEAEAAFTDLASYSVLSRDAANSAEDLLSNAIREECFADHLNNLILIAAFLDTSGQVKAVMRRLNHDNRHVRARALEVLDNTGNMKVNRLVISLLEASDKERPGKESVDHTVSASHDSIAVAKTYCTNANRWVRVCAEYACNRQGRM